MNKIFWSIPGVTIYLYVITILTQYGYNSYFNIPGSYIDASIKANTVYLYNLFQLAIQLFFLIGWWWLLIIPILIVVITLFAEKLKTLSMIVLILLALFGFYNFGNLIAKNQIRFMVPSLNCANVISGSFIIPVVYGEKLFLVPIDQENKIVGSFIPKDMSELSCGLEYRDTGVIKK